MKIKTVRSFEQAIINKRDSYLIKSTLGGEKKSFAKLTEHYKMRVYKLGMSFFKNMADAEDFVQEVFLKVYLKLDTFKEQSSFSTWLIRIAYNIGVNSINRRKDYLPIAQEENIEYAGYTPEENQIRKVTVQAVKEAVKELPPNNSICLELYFFYDMSYEEICSITDFPLNTIKSHIFRAKKILREKLRGFYE